MKPGSRGVAVDRAAIDKRRVADDDAEIRNLLARLVHIVDGRGSIDDLVARWAADCGWSSPNAGTWEGHQGHRDRHAKFQSQGVQGQDARSVHFLTTTAVRIEGDDAWATSTFLYVRDIDGRP